MKMHIFGKFCFNFIRFLSEIMSLKVTNRNLVSVYMYLLIIIHKMIHSSLSTAQFDKQAMYYVVV